MPTPPDEREELVLFTHADPTALVSSFTPAIWRACERAGGKLEMSRKRKGKEVARDYSVPLARLQGPLSHIATLAREKAQQSRATNSGV